MLLTLCSVHFNMYVVSEEKLRGSIESVCAMVFFMTTHPEEASLGDKRNPV